MHPSSMHRKNTQPDMQVFVLHVHCNIYIQTKMLWTTAPQGTSWLWQGFSVLDYLLDVSQVIEWASEHRKLFLTLIGGGKAQTVKTTEMLDLIREFSKVFKKNGTKNKFFRETNRSNKKNKKKGTAETSVCLKIVEEHIMSSEGIKTMDECLSDLR